MAPLTTMQISPLMIIAVLTGCGVYLSLRGRTFPVVLGLTMLSYAVNLFLFVTGRVIIGSPPRRSFVRARYRSDGARSPSGRSSRS